MDTPIYDFLKKYSGSDFTRLHMPGHKGNNFLGCEAIDITEIQGADNLYQAEGIIKKSEENTSKIFNTGATFYSTEGSTLCIKAMIYTVLLAHPQNQAPRIIAVRNVHKSFIYACAELGIDIEWIYPDNTESIISCKVTCDEIKKALHKAPNALAVYLTSPDYLGQMSDIESIATVCHNAGIPLLVDNAHGAYLKFFDMHPIDLGADMCCDSAHKTMPVLTGGAYLHVSCRANKTYSPFIKNALSAFGSTSPSYLTLASLDLCNEYMANGLGAKLREYANKINELKEYLSKYGYEILQSEPLKLTILADGDILSAHLRECQIEPEYSDKTCVVMMLNLENSQDDLLKIQKALTGITPPKPSSPPKLKQSNKIINVRQAFLSPYTTADVEASVGCVCASPCISCPPAVPIVISGEVITPNHVEILKFYNHKTIQIIKGITF